MNFVYCAQCGERLEVFNKAVPAQARVYNLIRPHDCDKATSEPVTEKTIREIRKNEVKAIPPDLNAMFDSFGFVQKLNSLEPKRDPSMKEVHEENHGDKRSKEHLRKELITSTAPIDLLNNIKNLPSSKPVGDIKEEPKGD